MVTTGTPALSRGASLATQTRAGNLARACTAELIGTFMLVLVGTGRDRRHAGQEHRGPAYNSLAVALAFGLILIPVVGARGPGTAAPRPPPRTRGLATAGRFP